MSFGRGTQIWIVCVLATATSSCASWFDESEQWRDAVVQQVSDARGIGPGVDRSCIEGRSNQATGLVAVVRYRIRRASRDLAVPVDPQMSLQAGEHVLAHPELCRVKRFKNVSSGPDTSHAVLEASERPVRSLAGFVRNGGSSSGGSASDGLGEVGKEFQIEALP